MFEEFAAYGAVVAAMAYLGRRLFAATLMPALARLWPQRPLLRRFALPSGAGRPADVHPCTGCRGCAGQRQQPRNQVVRIRRNAAADR